MAFTDPNDPKQRVKVLEEALRELMTAIRLADIDAPVTTSNWAYQRASDLVNE
jgi:hypothetical protein